MLRVIPVALCIGLVAHAAPLHVGFEPVADRLSHTTPAGEAEGFAVDVMRAVARDQHLDIVPVVKPWPQLLDEFRAGQIDVIGAVVATPEREPYIAFSTPQVDLQSAIFVRTDSPRRITIDNIANLKFGTTQLSAGHEYLLRRGWTNLRFYPRLLDALAGLERGECDAVLAVQLFGRHFIEQEHLQHIVEAGINVDDMHYKLRFGAQPNATALLAQLNDGLANIHADGTYDKIYEHWIGPLEARRVRFKDVQTYALVLTAIGLGVLVALYWQRRLLSRLARQAEELRKSEERLMLVLEGSEDGFWDWNMEFDYLERSERWAAMLGYTVAEIPPTQAGGRALIHPDDLNAYATWRPRLESGETDRYDIEYRMKAKNGEWRWIHDRGKVVKRAADGRPLRMTGTHTDITERKRTEQALKESREQLARSAHLLEQTQAVARIGGWEMDLRTDQVYWSAETYRLHEIAREDYLPTVETMIKYYVGESRAIIGHAIENAVRHGTPYDLELDLQTARQRLIRVHTTGRAERVDGRVVRLYGSLRDVTAEKAAEEDRRKIHLKMLEAQKLESLGVLAGGIAHDFNNLLTIILANATFAREVAGSDDDERLAHIETAARRAADLCRQMLAYAGRGSFLVERTDLGQLVQDTARLLLVSISKKANLQVALEPEVPAVNADASQIRQVVMNLVINASESLGENSGDIRLALRRGRPVPAPGAIVHSFDLPAGECACLEVADSGCGMNPTTLARVFDPFFTTKFAGRGLGLAAVLGIVRAHSGALTVESAPGRGTTFRLFLPVASAATASATETAAPTAMRVPRGETILLVDDEPVVLATADALLRHAGYRTVLAADGHEAVNQFRANPRGFAAVLLDLTMPGLDGAEVLHVIRALHPNVRVLIMSGFSEADVNTRVRGQDPVPILRKPFTQETLLAKITELLHV